MTMSSSTLHRHFEEYVQYAEIKHLAYNIAALQKEKMFHTLTVLSCFPEEGKTLLCAALAMAYAEAFQSRVLVVDATSLQNKNSLRLKSCFNGSSPLVELTSLAEMPRKSQPSPAQLKNAPVLETTVMKPEDQPVRVTRENHFSTIKTLMEDASRQYGLILIDTTPLQARNKGNMDPLLVARLSGASILVTSRKFLDAPTLNTSLKILKDPTLHLVGIVSNEGWTS